MSPLAPASPVCPPVPVPDLVDVHDLVRTADRRLRGETPSALLLRASGHPPRLGAFAFSGEHPIENLLGFEAPHQWHALGVRCAGVGTALDPIDHDDGPFGITGPTDVVVTFLIDRHGRSAGLLRHGAEADWLDEPPAGRLGDACRRALRLPTDPPPPSTADLWLRVWLDRLLEAATDGRHRGITGWDDAVQLHPARPGPVDEGIGPARVAEATLILAERWPWSRLRREPEAVDTGRPPLPPDLAAWMDEGMLARWLLDQLSPLPALLAALRLSLAPELVEILEDTVLLTGLRPLAR